MDHPLRTKALQYVQGALTFGDQVIFPHHIDQYITSFADDQFGPNWVESAEVAQNLDAGLQKILSSLKSVKPIEHDMTTLLAYTLAFSPLNFHKIPFLLRNLMRKSPPPTEVKVLDAGAGAGLASLSVVYFYELLSNAVRLCTGEGLDVHLTFTPVDRDPASLPVYQQFLSSYKPAFPEITIDVSTPIQADISATPEELDATFGSESFDYILLSHVLGEIRSFSLTRRAAILVEMAKRLSENGSLLVVESAYGGQPQELNQIKSRAVDAGLTLYGPCSTAWEKPAGRQCYSCASVSYEVVTRPQISQIISLISDFPFDDLCAKNAWTYGVLRIDDMIHHAQLETGSGLFARISELADSLPEDGRCNIYGMVARIDATREGEPLYRICDQTCGSNVAYMKFAADVGIPPLEMGDVLELESVKVEESGRGRNKLFLVVDADCNLRNLSFDFRHMTSRLALNKEVISP